MLGVRGFFVHQFALICLVLPAFVVLETATQGADWPQFLGPSRNGIANSSPELVDAFPPTGPIIRWRSPGGIGMSGLSVAQGKCVTICRRGGMQTLVALDRNDGSTLWESPISEAYDNSMGNGARATPTIDDGRVFSFTGEGILSANRLDDGAKLWTRNILRDLGGKPAEYGLASSPLVIDGMVIVQAGAAQANIIALNGATGRIVWQAGAGTAGYSSPALLTVAGEPQVVAFTGSQCLGIDPQSGEVLWQYDYVTEYDCNTATPVSVGGRVLLSSGENHGSVLLDVTKRNGSYQVEEVWTNQGTKASLRAEWQTPILSDGVLFGFDNVGSAGPVTNLACIEAATGKVLWKKMRFGKSNGVLADGKLIVSTMQGELVLVTASKAGFRELARAEIMEKTRQAPCFSDGFVFLRDDQEILCVSLRAEDY